MSVKLRIESCYMTTAEFEQGLMEGQIPSLDLLFFERELSRLDGIAMAAGLYAIKIAVLQVLGLEDATCLDLCLLHDQNDQQRLFLLKDSPLISHIDVGFYHSSQSTLAIAVARKI